jgi:hypothetical protein
MSIHHVWRAALICDALLSLLPTAGAQSQDVIGATITAHGVTVSLLVPGMTYPRRALIQATVVARNESGTDISVPSSCDNNNPGLEVVRHDATTGRFDIPAYPPALPEERTMPCLPVLLSLRPGQTLTNQGFVVLRNAYLEAFVQIQTGAGMIQVTTPQLHFHLTREQPPLVRFQSRPSFIVKLWPPAGASGLLRYVEYGVCPFRSGGYRVTGEPDWRTWETAATTRLTAGCRHPAVWDMLAGWVGFSVVRIRYQSPGVSPARLGAVGTAG